MRLRVVQVGDLVSYVRFTHRPYVVRATYSDGGVDLAQYNVQAEEPLFWDSVVEPTYAFLPTFGGLLCFLPVLRGRYA
jgi:hypothetical protein